MKLLDRIIGEISCSRVLVSMLSLHDQNMIYVHGIRNRVIRGSNRAVRFDAGGKRFESVTKLEGSLNRA